MGRALGADRFFVLIGAMGKTFMGVLQKFCTMRTKVFYLVFICAISAYHALDRACFSR